MDILADSPVKDPSPCKGWACRAVPACHRETCEGNFETSLPKFRKGRLKGTEPTGRRAVQARCERLPNLHPLCWSVAKGIWGAIPDTGASLGLTGNRFERSGQKRSPARDRRKKGRRRVLVPSEPVWLAATWLPPWGCLGWRFLSLPWKGRSLRATVL